MSKELYQKVLEDEELREDLLKLCHKVKIELRDEFIDKLKTYQLVEVMSTKEKIKLLDKFTYTHETIKKIEGIESEVLGKGS